MLSDRARRADRSSAIDGGLHPVLAVIGALIRDAHEPYRVAGRRRAIGVAGARLADGAEDARRAAAVAVGLVGILDVVEAVAVHADERHGIAVTTAGGHVAARRRRAAVRVDEAAHPGAARGAVASAVHVGLVGVLDARRCTRPGRPRPGRPAARRRRWRLRVPYRTRAHPVPPRRRRVRWWLLAGLPRRRRARGWLLAVPPRRRRGSIEVCAAESAFAVRAGSRRSRTAASLRGRRDPRNRRRARAPARRSEPRSSSRRSVEAPFHARLVPHPKDVRDPVETIRPKFATSPGGAARAPCRHRVAAGELQRPTSCSRYNFW